MPCQDGRRSGRCAFCWRNTRASIPAPRPKCSSVLLARSLSPIPERLGFPAARLELLPIHRELISQAEGAVLGYTDIVGVGDGFGFGPGPVMGAAQALVAAGLLAPAVQSVVSVTD